MASVLKPIANDSILHNLNPLARIGLAFCICIAAFFSNSILYLCLLLVLNLALGVVGGVTKKTFALLAGLSAACALLFLLQLVFIRTGEPVFLFVTTEGLQVAIVLVLRLFNATLPLVLMLAITQMNDLANALVKVVRLPYTYAFAITTALRFIPVFMAEMSSIIEVQIARGVNFDTRNPFKKLKMVAPLCVPLLIGSVVRTEQAAMAAELRGFYLRDRKSGSKEYPFRAYDLAAALLAAFLICGSAVTSLA